jgi:CMP-N,N'-diacetyllegionaminic acid synthase
VSYQPPNVLVVDIDGTLTNGEFPYADATPRLDVIEKVNAFYDAGWRIELFTARGMNRFADTGYPKQHAEEAFLSLTYKWLRDHGVKFHRLQFGKPAAIYYIDDKSLTPEAFLAKDLSL